MQVTFEQLTVGQSYSRPQLAELWGYKKYNAIARGVVTPRGSNTILLFITVEKQSHLTQYRDSLDGTNLVMEGEKNHGGDQRIINAATSGDEIHLFYRKRHHEDFTYYGTVRLVRSEQKRRKP